MDRKEKYKLAKERVKEIKDFYSHLIIYLIVNLLIFLINYIVSPGVYWFYWPLIGWGIGLAIHWTQVFGLDRFFGKDWEERKIEEIVNEMDKKDKSERELND